jgi:hypothetical protein
MQLGLSRTMIEKRGDGPELAGSECDEQDFLLGPPEGVSPAPWEAAGARQALLRALSQPTSEERPAQFSLAEMGALVTFASVVLAVAHYLPLPAFAGVTGAAVVLAMYCDHLIPPRARWLTWAWMGLAVTYIATAIAAIVRG